MSSPDSQQFPISFPISGQTDANGEATITVFGFLPSLAAAWNLYMNLPGNAPQVQVFQGAGIGGIPIGSAGAIAGQCQVGPLYSYGSATVTIQVSGADPNLPIQGMIAGLQSSDPADLSAIAGQSSGTVGTTTAYDGQPLISESAALGNSAHAADITYPVPGTSAGLTFDVRLWASVLVGIRMNTAATGKAVLVTFRWFANSDGSRLIGQESFIIDDIVATVIATLPNLGPFMQVVVNRLPGTATWDWNCSLLTSQRIVSAVYGGNFTPYLMELFNQNIAGGANFTNPFGTVYAGPCWFSYRATGGQPGTFRIDALGTDGAYHTGNIYQDALAAGGVQAKAIILPSSPCRINISNTGGGAANFTAVVFSSPTGSS